MQLNKHLKFIKEGIVNAFKVHLYSVRKRSVCPYGKYEQHLRSTQKRVLNVRISVRRESDIKKDSKVVVYCPDVTYVTVVSINGELNELGLSTQGPHCSHEN